MQWPIPFPDELRAGTVTVRPYRPADAAEVFVALADDRVWEHMSRGTPEDAVVLDRIVRAALDRGGRITFTVRQDGRAVGITSVLVDPDDPDDPAGVEVGGTLLAPSVWGTGVNAAAKGLLLTAAFEHGAEWVQLRTDERNGRSATAIGKLGAHEIDGRDEPVRRRDGTPRRSRIFRLDRPPPSGAG